MASEIHSTAIIQPGAEIGVDVQIGPYAVIGPHVKIGDRSKIGSHVVIEGHTTIGEACMLSQFASLGAVPQDLKYKGEPSQLILGKGNMVREFVTMHIGTATGTMVTRIGDNNLFMANSHVAHDCQIGNNCVFANSVALAGHVQVGNNAILGGLAGVHQFCRVGTYAIISAGSMIGSDVAPYCMGQGDRCQLRGLNLIGLKRAGMSVSEVAAIKRAYRHFFSSVGHFPEKIASLPEDLATHPRVQVLVDFIQKSGKRGLCQARRLGVAEDEDFQA